MSSESGLMPEEHIYRQERPFVQLKVKDLQPEHGEGFIGVGDVAVDEDRVCWVLLDAPVFGSEFQDVAPIILRRSPDSDYAIQMGGLPDKSKFALVPAPDASTWVRAKVVEASGI